MNHVLNIPLEVQQESLWCWAAVSTMAVKSFSDDPVLAQMTQLRTVACRLKGVRTKTMLAVPQTLSDVQDSETFCADPGNCNGTGFPWLLDVNYTTVPAGQKLTKQRLIDEIRTNRRPVIVMWNYSKVPRSAGNFPTSTHYLIVTGYDEATDWFRVTDPWPTAGPEAGAAEEHEHYVTYAGYVDPQVSLGLPVSAVHESDRYNLRRMVNGGYQVPDVAPDEDVEPVGEIEEVVLEPVDFGEIGHLDHDVQAIAHHRIVYAHDGSVVGGTKRAGESFPIVGLTTQQILEAHGEPHRLLVQQAWALIAPVTAGSGGKVVDSFQMYRTRDGWKEGGYTNSRIAKLMIKAAKRLRRETHADGRIYLVSIPEQVMFFAASGEGATANLISLDDDANGRVLSGKMALDQVRKFIDSHRENLADRDPGPRR